MPQRPLTARADMRRGFTINPRRRLIEMGKFGDTPGPAGYTPHAAGDLAIKVGQGKNAEMGHQVHDSLCWAGSALTSKGASISVTPFPTLKGLQGADSPGPARYSLARFPRK